MGDAPLNNKLGAGKISMSYTYEGLVVAATSATVLHLVESKGVARALDFRVIQLRSNLTGLVRVAEASDSLEPELIMAAGLAISAAVAPCLAVFYDDHVALRCSVLFIAGAETVRFTEADELWVPLLESGEPDLAAPRLRVSELIDDDEHEYETVANAIGLGIAALDPACGLTAAELRDAFVDVDEE